MRTKLKNLRNIKGLRDIKTMHSVSKKPSLKIPPLDVRIGRGGFGMGRPIMGRVAPTPKEKWIERPPKKPEKIKPPEVEKDPLVDVFDEKKEIIVVIELPGLEKKDIKTGTKGNILTISMETEKGKYTKEVNLPSKVTGKIKSIYRNGVLTIVGRKPPVINNG